MKLQRLWSDESGQAIVVAALALVVMIAMVGLAVDVGRLRYVKHHLQQTADAAALAAGLELRVCGSITTGCAAMQTAASQAMLENGVTVDHMLSNCSAPAASGVSLSINRPVCALGASDPNNGKTTFVETVVTSVERTYFARILGFDNIPLTARAEAGRAPGPCIYALDPSAAGAITVLVGLVVHSNCNIVDESNNAAALTCVVGAFLSAPRINVTGGTANLLCGLSTRARTGVPVPVPADPLAYLEKPTNLTCGSSTGSPYYGSSSAVNVILGGNVTFNPGVYCGGISLTASLLSNVTFNPGVYVLKTGPGILGIPSGGLNINISLLSNITGNGVTFYNLGPVGGISVTAPATLGLTNFVLTAPTTGKYAGILFFQDSTNTSSGVFLASLLVGGKMEGAVYLPNASVSYGVSAISSAYNILVAKTIQFNVSVASTFGADYSQLPGGSPIASDDDVLVQ